MAVNYGSGCSEIKTTKKWHEGVEKVPLDPNGRFSFFFFNDCIRLQRSDTSCKQFLLKTYEPIWRFLGVRTRV